MDAYDLASVDIKRRRLAMIKRTNNESRIAIASSDSAIDVRELNTRLCEIWFKFFQNCVADASASVNSNGTFDLLVKYSLDEIEDEYMLDKLVDEQIVALMNLAYWSNMYVYQLTIN